MNTKITDQDSKSISDLSRFLVSSQFENGPMAGFLVRYQSLFGCGDPYPEITGYAATSFARLYDLTGDERFLERAVLAADGLLAFQNRNGSIPTVINKAGLAKNLVHVFDLAIIARGILDVYRRTEDVKYLEAAIAAIEFLRENYIRENRGDVLDVDGLAISHDFPENFWINLKLIISFEQLHSVNKDSSLLLDAELLYKRLINSFQRTGYFGSSYASPYNRSHYHAYALYGLVHYYKLTGDSSCLDILHLGINKLSDLMTSNGGVYTNFSENGEAILQSGVDVPVSAQLAELLIFKQKTTDSGTKEINIMLEKLEGFLSAKVYSGKYRERMKGGLPFILAKRRPPYLVAWGVEFSVNYFYDKYELGGI